MDVLDCSLVESYHFITKCFNLQEEVRSKLNELEAYQKTEIERSTSAMAWVEKYTETRREMDDKLDKQYRRKMYVFFP